MSTKRILYIQYTNPAAYPPLQHSSRILADAGWDVLFLGTSAMGANALEFPPHQNVVVRRMRFCRGGLWQKFHYFGFALWVLWTALTWGPKWIYASDPLSCPVVLMVIWLPRLSFLYHEHDSMPAESHPGRFRKLLMYSRRFLARRAAVCVLPNERRRARFQAELGLSRPPVCVWNCPGIEEVSRRSGCQAGPDRWVVYHGSIGPALVPRTLIEALRYVPDIVKLRITGYETIGSAGYTEELSRLAQSLGVRSRVEFNNPLSRFRLLLANSDAHIGLALMPMRHPNSNYEGMVGASNKAFDYLASGLALLVSDLPDWRETFVKPGFALACNSDDPRSIAMAINELVDNPDRMRAMGEAGRQRILSDWNYEKWFSPVMQRLTASIAVPAFADSDESSPAGPCA